MLRRCPRSAVTQMKLQSWESELVDMEAQLLGVGNAIEVWGGGSCVWHMYIGRVDCCSSATARVWST